MPDYKKMYCRMLEASEKAINILIEAQRECEELYITSPEPEIVLLSKQKAEETGEKTE